tara:strand:+ start:15 stop:668 length:654 start_codon:yes stop_codon:yes gene_type:complete
MSSVFIYGGTFDPVHNGHINTAQNVYNRFKPDEFLFIPCKQPVLKSKNQASAKHRLAMLERALESLQPKQAFSICTYELQSKKPSYMVHTLEYLQEIYPENTVFILIMGTDTFLEFHKWHQWKKIIELCNILLLERADNPLSNIPLPLQDLMSRHFTNTLDTLCITPSGNISLFNAGQYSESSTEIRKRLRHDKSINALCPSSVAEYISQHDLYRDV